MGWQWDVGRNGMHGMGYLALALLHELWTRITPNTKTKTKVAPALALAPQSG
jgi:hypothetical protein